jgi:glycosyltransferase involved in cell wall biosynthesis
VVVIYHIGPDSLGSAWERALVRAAQPLCLRHLRAAEQVVTISRFWEDRVRALGNPRVRTIYSAHDEADFAVTDADVAGFRARFGLTKPIVYIGNCQPAKGVVESHAALSGLDVHLATSGRRLVRLSALNLDAGYREYLTLLAASSVVVTMSKFDEGWCRTAHEAMLLRRPVVGSGRGGMGELLGGGGQVVCTRFDDLRAHVEALLADPARAAAQGEAGYRFARSFTTERFRREWTEVLTG